MNNAEAEQIVRIGRYDETVTIPEEVREQMDAIIKRMPWKYTGRQELVDRALKSFFGDDRIWNEINLTSAEIREFADDHMNADRTNDKYDPFSLEGIFRTVEDMIQNFATEIAYKVIEGLLMNGCYEVAGRLEGGTIDEDHPESVARYTIPVPGARAAHRIVN